MSTHAGQGAAMPAPAHAADQINSCIIRLSRPRPDSKSPAFLHPGLALRRAMGRARRTPPRRCCDHPLGVEAPHSTVTPSFVRFFGAALAQVKSMAAHFAEVAKSQAAIANMRPSP